MSVKENKDSKEFKFDSFINKTIILSSKRYFKKEMITLSKQTYLLDNIYDPLSLEHINNVELSLDLEDALGCLSQLEQAVIFLLYEKELSQKDASKILEIYSKSTSRIKARAISKLRKYLKESDENGK